MKGEMVLEIRCEDEKISTFAMQPAQTSTCWRSRSKATAVNHNVSVLGSRSNSYKGWDSKYGSRRGYESHEARRYGSQLKDGICNLSSPLALYPCFPIYSYIYPPHCLLSIAWWWPLVESTILKFCGLHIYLLFFLFLCSFYFLFFK